MSNAIAHPLQALILQAAKKPQVTGTVARFQRRIKTASETIVILADVSSSMAELAGTKRKIDLLQEALRHVLSALPSVRLFAFSSYPQEVTPFTLPQPNGGTDLTAALRQIQPLAPRKTIVISDGQPDNPTTAIAAAHDLAGVIDIIYCGPDSDTEAIGFMQRLAAVGGGSVTVTNIVRPGADLALSLRRTLSLPDLREGK